MGMSSQKGFLRCGDPAGNRVWGAGIRVCPAPRGPHRARGRFDGGGATMARAYTLRGIPYFRGQWANAGKGVRDRYLGLKFQINGETHFGWARLNVSVQSHGPANVTATLTGYAYETVANKPIIAGKTKGADVITVQPATLGHLAAGASVIPARRRTDQ